MSGPIWVNMGSTATAVARHRDSDVYCPEKYDSRAYRDVTVGEETRWLRHDWRALAFPSQRTIGIAYRMCTNCGTVRKQVLPE